MGNFGIARASLLTLTLLAIGCSADFDTTRRVGPRGSLGRELYAVVCDRVGAQALRDDVAGASFHAVCHPDTSGAYAAKVDRTQLPPFRSDAVNVDGIPVSVEQQQANRNHRIARIEALGRRREELVTALDAVIPDVHIPRASTTTPEGKACDAPPDDGRSDLELQAEMARTLGRFIDLYEDETIPQVTRALGHTLDAVKADPDAQRALARFDARKGYRPIPTALGMVRPLLAYPRLADLARSLMRILSPDAGNEGEASRAFDDALRAAYQELRTPDLTPPQGDLLIDQDSLVPGRTVLSRPRTFLEGARQILATEADVFKVGDPEYIAKRDARGYVALFGHGVPAPFVDLTGPNGIPDLLPDVGDFGEFRTNGGDAPSPFLDGEVNGQTFSAADRDTFGRPTRAGGALVYDYRDTKRTFLASMVRDIKPFFASAKDKETAMNLLAALPALAGGRDVSPTAHKVYPPDPREAEDWKLAHKAPMPPGLGTTPVNYNYRGFHADGSPAADFVHAFGQIADAPEIDDLLAVAQQLFAPEHMNDMASLVGMALDVKAMGEKHVEAQLADKSTFWDDVLVQLAKVAHEPGLLEDILRGFADPKTLPMENVLASFVETKDDISYDHSNLNGPARNLTTNTAPPNFVTHLDRSKPDVGENRSELQKFLALLHDTNGLAICTKDDAIVHIRAKDPNLGIPIEFDYPHGRNPGPIDTNVSTSALICGIVGSSAPKKLPQCGLFAFTNVMDLLLGVVIGRESPDEPNLLEVHDDCLNKLLHSPVVSLVNGADAFLEQISGVNGFTLFPNVRGFARLLYYETPYQGLPEDTNASSVKTHDFLRDTIDPIPSMVCPLDPHTVNGTYYPTRKCTTVNDTLRARDRNALFPVDELGFVDSLRPIARAFKKHQKPLYFADLFDVLHIHWGSSQQPKDVCDPSLPRTDARWCSQDGLVSYEPLLAEVLHKGIFARLQSFVSMLAKIEVTHCNAYDDAPKGARRCKAGQTVKTDGLHVVSEALVKMVDPARTPGLTDRQGNTKALRNDGQRIDPIAPMHLLLDAFNGMDAAFASFASIHPGDADRRAMWRAARSEFVDTFLAVQGEGAQARFQNSTLVTILPAILDVVRAQIAANCNQAGPCTWARTDLPARFDETLEGPMFAALVDLVDAIRKDDTARLELEKLLTYMVDATSGNEAQAGVLAATLDALQLLEDDTNLSPFKRILADGVGPAVVADDGKVVRRSLADAGTRVLSRIFERKLEGTGEGACVRERDPNRALGTVLERLVTPMGPTQAAPIETIMSVIGDVNRADPDSNAKFNDHDYASIANEMSAFCLDQSRGLEQFYSVIREATRQ